MFQFGDRVVLKDRPMVVGVFLRYVDNLCEVELSWYDTQYVGNCFVKKDTPPNRGINLNVPWAYELEHVFNSPLYAELR